MKGRDEKIEVAKLNQLLFDLNPSTLFDSYPFFPSFFSPLIGLSLPQPFRPPSLSYNQPSSSIFRVHRQNERNRTPRKYPVSWYVVLSLRVFVRD